MARKQVTLIFPQHLIKEPVIYMMSKEYEVVPNIRRAKVTDQMGNTFLLRLCKHAAFSGDMNGQAGNVYRSNAQ